MDLGSLFAGLGAPPPNPPINQGSGNLLIILIVLLIIFAFGKDGLGFGYPGIRGYYYPQQYKIKHHKHHHKNKCCPIQPLFPTPNPLFLLILAGALLLFWRPRPVRPAAC